MKKTRFLLPMLCLPLLYVAPPVLAQDFLSSVSAQAPALGANGAFSSGGATGDQNHSSNLMTGAGALNGGVVGGRTYGLVGTRSGLLSPNSVDNEPIPSGQFSYGFTQLPQGPSIGISVGAGSDGPSVGLNFDLGGLDAPIPNATYAGQPLPTVSTSSVDLNTVDCPFLRQNGGWGSSQAMPGIGIGIGIGIGAGGVGVGISAGSSDPSVGSIQTYFGE